MHAQCGVGKSTLLASILGFLKPSHGQIAWQGASVKDARPALVMQEPRAAFNPVWPLKRALLEASPRIDKQRLERMCAGLELPLDLFERKPLEVSIGQAQRVGILRALIAAPPLVLFDEPLSALDAVTQKHTTRLIKNLQQEENFAALIVTHDLGYALSQSDHVAVLQAGEIAESSCTETFTVSPKSAYGKALRDAAVSLGSLERTAE